MNEKSIIIADDDEDDVELFKSLALEFCPELQINAVENGNELMRLLELTPVPNIIILDLNMPYKSGKECLLEIRARKKFDDVKVIILSTSDHIDDMNYCMYKKADNYFVKPSSIEGLKKIIAFICDEKSVNYS
ncbi:MAG: response regulator [Bacteroidota bacterium]